MAEAVAHGGDELDQVRGVLARDRDAQDAVARHGEHLDQAMRLLVGDRTVQLVDPVDRDLVWNVHSFASVSFSPTRATSGSVNVAHGITE